VQAGLGIAHCGLEGKSNNIVTTFAFEMRNNETKV
jgi:hypothetical protein